VQAVPVFQDQARYPAPFPSSHCISGVMKPPMQSSWPISVATTGTAAATAAGATSQQAADTQALKL